MLQVRDEDLCVGTIFAVSSFWVIYQNEYRMRFRDTDTRRKAMRRGWGGAQATSSAARMAATFYLSIAERRLGQMVARVIRRLDVPVSVSSYRAFLFYPLPPIGAD